ncbi:putative cytochrome P450 [Rosa chinensis]|uniref:Putative cytochrome P450 n=1 Tax=Rosa chinensis TaxID=74649 RepID=A0A2P6PYF3_ROSCH|nr:cytochrome P450 CYP82D47 [Rosa chinensis]PRQ26953.1 putative cytochrome P450 [Rosa chinensis]
MDHLLAYVHLYVTAGLIFAITIVLYFYYFSQRRTWRASAKRRLAPQAKGAWPVLGHLPLLGGSTPPQIILGAMADKYGPLFTIRLGIYPTLVVSSSEMAKECFTIHDMAASSRPKMAAVELMGYNYAMFGFAPSGPYWREVRKLATLGLLSNRRIQLLKDIRISEVASFLKELYNTWSASSTTDHNHIALVELKQWFGDLTLNVILRMVAGKRYSFISDSANDDEKKEAGRVQDAVRKLFYFTGVFLVGDSVPYLRWLDLGGHEKAMKKTAKEIDAILGEWIQEHKQRRRAGDTGDHDFMDAMLTVLQGEDLGGYDADTVNKATCLDLILGGSDTTMATLTWAVSLLLNNRQVLKQAQDELDAEVGREKIVSESDTSKLVYIQAIVKETLRLYPAVPLSAQHEFTEDCTVNGYHVEKGTRLITNLWKIQTNPRIWPDPLEFKPERFLTTHMNMDVRGQHFELIPFGSGRRSCPGLSFALQMVQFTLASFLHAFEISTPSNELVDMSESFGLTNVKATPLKVFIKPRLCTKLYE